jgi:hypothetical protein
MVVEKVKVFENEALRIFGCRRDGLNLYSSCSIVKVVNFSQTEHVGCVG